MTLASGSENGLNLVLNMFRTASTEGSTRDQCYKTFLSVIYEFSD
jgi:hypothetical protein